MIPVYPTLPLQGLLHGRGNAALGTNLYRGTHVCYVVAWVILSKQAVYKLVHAGGLVLCAVFGQYAVEQLVHANGALSSVKNLLVVIDRWRSAMDHILHPAAR